MTAMNPSYECQPWERSIPKPSLERRVPHPPKRVLDEKTPQKYRPSKSHSMPAYLYYSMESIGEVGHC